MSEPAAAPADAPDPAPISPSGDAGGAPLDEDELRERVAEALRTVYDPEIPVNIYELGLVYKVATNPEGDVHIEMTLTAPNCPAAQSLPGEVEAKARAVEGVREARVVVVWEPPWSQDRMSDGAKLQLGLL